MSEGKPRSRPSVGSGSKGAARPAAKAQGGSAKKRRKYDSDEASSEVRVFTSMVLSHSAVWRLSVWVISDRFFQRCSLNDDERVNRRL